MNVLLLNLVALARGHVDPRWLTYRNAEQLGGHVRKGEKGASIVFWKFLPTRDRGGDPEPDALTDDEQERKLIPFARSYTVFNVEQCEGLALPPLVEEEASDVNECNELAEQILALPNLKHAATRPAICRVRIWCFCRTGPALSMVIFIFRWLSRNNTLVRPRQPVEPGVRHPLR
jgi:hypothetical protein